MNLRQLKNKTWACRVSLLEGRVYQGGFKTKKLAKEWGELKESKKNSKK